MINACTLRLTGTLLTLLSLTMAAGATASPVATTATSPAVAPVAAPVLTVEAVAGSASAEHLGEVRKLAPGDVINEREVLSTAGGGRLKLRFASEGALELGSDASLAIEKLPPSATANDRRSIVSLLKGYLRVQWSPQPKRTVWPFYLYFGGQRSGLVPGEYFFERGHESIRGCVASGRLTMTAIAGDGVETLRPGACYDLRVAEAAIAKPRKAETWEAMRREFRLDPTGAPDIVQWATLDLPPATTDADADPATALLAGVIEATGLSPPPASAPAVGPNPVLTSPATKPSAVTTPAAADSPAATIAAKPANPVPAPVPASVAIADGASAGWTLLIGSFASPDNAAQVEGKLRASGYVPFTRVKQVDGRTWHSVQVRGFPSREVAEAKAEDVRGRLGFSTVRVVHLQ